MLKLLKNSLNEDEEDEISLYLLKLLKNSLNEDEYDEEDELYFLNKISTKCRKRMEASRNKKFHKKDQKEHKRILYDMIARS